MKIETKYSFGDKVWVMDKSSPRQLTVRQIEVRMDNWWTSPNKYERHERYFLASGSTAFCHHEWYSSKQIFATKEELLVNL